MQFTLTGAPEALTFAGLNLFAVAEDPIDPTAVSGSWINSGGLYDQAAYQVWQGGVRGVSTRWRWSAAPG